MSAPPEGDENNDEKKRLELQQDFESLPSSFESYVEVIQWYIHTFLTDLRGGSFSELSLEKVLEYLRRIPEPLLDKEHLGFHDVAGITPFEFVSAQNTIEVSESEKGYFEEIAKSVQGWIDLYEKRGVGELILSLKQMPDWMRGLTSFNTDADLDCFDQLKAIKDIESLWQRHDFTEEGLSYLIEKISKTYHGMKREDFRQEPLRRILFALGVFKGILGANVKEGFSIGVLFDSKVRGIRKSLDHLIHHEFLIQQESHSKNRGRNFLAIQFRQFGNQMGERLRLRIEDSHRVTVLIANGLAGTLRGNFCAEPTCASGRNGEGNQHRNVTLSRDSLLLVPIIDGEIRGYLEFMKERAEGYEQPVLVLKTVQFEGLTEQGALTLFSHLNHQAREAGYLGVAIPENLEGKTNLEENRVVLASRDAVRQGTPLTVTPWDQRDWDVVKSSLDPLSETVYYEEAVKDAYILLNRDYLSSKKDLEVHPSFRKPQIREEQTRDKGIREVEAHVLIGIGLPLEGDLFETYLDLLTSSGRKDVADLLRRRADKNFFDRMVRFLNGVIASRSTLPIERAENEIKNRIEYLLKSIHWEKLLTQQEGKVLLQRFCEFLGKEGEERFRNPERFIRAYQESVNLRTVAVLEAMPEGWFPPLFLRLSGNRLEFIFKFIKDVKGRDFAFELLETIPLEQRVTHAKQLFTYLLGIEGIEGFHKRYRLSRNGRAIFDLIKGFSKDALSPNEQFQALRCLLLLEIEDPLSEEISESIKEALSIIKEKLRSWAAMRYLYLSKIEPKDLFRHARVLQKFGLLDETEVEILTIDAAKRKSVEAIRALGEIGGKDALSALVFLSLRKKDKDWVVRQAVAEALGKHQGQEALNALLSLTKDKDFRVRHAAIEALGHFSSLNALLALVRESDDTVRQLAAEALGKQEGKEALDAFVALVRDEDGRLRAVAAEALGYQKEGPVVDLLVTLAEDPEEEVRCAVAKALGKQSGRGALETLIDLAGDPEESVRRVATKALGNHSDRDALVTLIVLARDSAWRIRQLAAEALGQHQGSEAMNILLSLVEDSDWGVRNSAIEALGHQKGPEVVKALLPFAKDQNAGVRHVVAKALGHQEGFDALAALLVLNKDQDPNVRLDAVKALGNHEGRGVLHALIFIATDLEQDFPEQRAAAEALGKKHGEKEEVQLILKRLALYGVEEAEEALPSVNKALGGLPNNKLLVRILLSGTDEDFERSLPIWERIADSEVLRTLHQLLEKQPHDFTLFWRISEVRKIVQSHKSAKPRVESVGRYFPEGASATLPAREGNISPHTLNVEALQALFLTLENAKDQTQAKEIFEKISSLLESMEPSERKEHLIRQISFLKTPSGALLLAHIQGTPLRTLSSGAHFGVALFIKQTLQALFGLDRKPMDKFMNEMPAALIDYFLFTGGAAIGSLGYDLGVELPFKFYKRLIYRKLVLSSAEARAKILEGFGKSHLNAIRNYTVYSSLLKRQAAFIAALSFMDWWHTGEVDGKRIAISWLSFALSGAVVEAGTDFLIVKIAGHAWKVKNLSGPWGWIATAVELGMTLLLAHEIEEEIHDFIETGQRELALQEKSLRLYEIALDENHTSDKIISYFNNEYHAEFKAFRDFRLRDLYVANLAYLKEFEEFRREHDLLYKANLEKESLESDVNDAEKNLRSPVAPRESLLSPTFPVLSRVLGHTPPQRDEYTVTDGSRRLARLRFLEIPRLQKDLTWKKTYEKQVQEFEADQEIEFGNAIESLREENFRSPLTSALLKYQESADAKDYNDYRKKVEFAAERSWGKGRWLYDTGVSITKIGIAKEIEDVRKLTATDNLIQELASVERIANELEKKESSERNQILADFFTAQTTILRMELMQLIEFLKDPFEIPVSAEEEKELELAYGESPETRR